MFCKSVDSYPGKVQNISFDDLFDGVLLVVVVFHVLIHINVNACGQKLLL